ncbi:MAG: diguanylate cyclase [Chloroflexales bacterium]
MKTRITHAALLGGSGTADLRGYRRMKTRITHAVLLGLLVFASACLGLAWFVIPPAAVPIIWPVSGIVLATLLLTTSNEWPLLLLSAGVATGLAQLWAGSSPLVSLALTLAHMAATLLAATLVRRWSAAPLAMTRLRDLVGLVAIAALASNALTALLGAGVAWASLGAPFWLSWQIWFVADGISVLLFTPLIFSWFGPPRPSLRQIAPWRVAEAGALLTSLLLVSGGVFVANARVGSADMFLFYLLFPLLIWAVLRFQMHGATVTTLIFASLLTLGVVHHQGPFVSVTTNPLAAILAAQRYLAVIIASAYVMSSLVSERAADHAAQVQAKEALRKSEATLRSFFDSAAVLMGIVEVVDDDILHISDNATTLSFFNLPPDQPFPFHASAVGIPREHIRLWRTQYAACAQCGAPVSFTYPHTTADGTYWLAATISQIAGSADAPPRFAYLVEDVTKRMDAEAALQAAHDRYAFQANHDHLTSLFNRLAITEHVEAELAQANQSSFPLSLALLDIDHFKAVNDRYGHVAGDQTLRHIAQIITETVRPSDWVGRWGGEEFLVVLSHTSLDDAALIAERVRTQITNRPLRLSNGTELRLTVSIGVASTGLPAEGTGNPEDLFQRADAVLYAAKHAGRNQVICAAPARMVACC